MLCCRGNRKREYSVNAEDDDAVVKEADLNGDAKHADTDIDKANGDIETPITVTVSDVTESAKPEKQTGHSNSTQNGHRVGDAGRENSGNYGIKKDSREASHVVKNDGTSTSVAGNDKRNPRYVSQMSMCSTLSIREEINRSRDQFFSNSSLYDPSLQEELSTFNKRLSHTDVKFAEYQRRLRNRKHLVEEEEMSAEQMQQAVSRLEAVASRLETLAVASPKPAAGAPAAASGPDPGASAPFVIGFDDLLKGEFARYLSLSATIGGDVQTQAGMVQAAFQAVRDVLITAAKSKKPAQNILVQILTPLSQHIQAIQEFREKNRTSPQFNHLSGVGESIPALGWVSVEPTPGPFVKDMQDAGMFFTNRVIKDYKEKDQTHVDWTKAWMGTLREMIAYVKQYHTTGVSWNTQGADAVVAPKAPVAAPAGGAPPPPPPGPPPPPPPAMDPSSGGDDGGSDAKAALFAEICRGTAITSGLKKVSDDMKTHKNPNLRGASVVSATSSSGVRVGPTPFKATAPPTAPKPAAGKPAPVAKAPVLELKEKKWMVEYQVGNKTMVIDDTNIKQVVYLYKCQDSTLQVKGKVNSITVDSCKKVAIAFDAVVSSIEFVNCQSVQAQTLGQCPTVSIDKTDGCQMYLSKESLNAEIVSAKSSEMNILVPKADGDFAEFALPEQFKSVWDGKKFTTDCTDI